MLKRRGFGGFKIKALGHQTAVTFNGGFVRFFFVFKVLFGKLFARVRFVVFAKRGGDIVVAYALSFKLGFYKVFALFVRVCGGVLFSVFAI